MTEIIFECSGFDEDQTIFQDVIREEINECFERWAELLEEFDIDATRVRSKDLFRGLSVIAGLLNDPRFDGAINISFDEVTGDFEVAEIYPVPAEFIGEPNE